MAILNSDVFVTPSVFDRLIDLDPASTREAPKSRIRNLEELKNAVRRDMEWLLNTRSEIVDLDERMEEVKRSVLRYGLPDFTGLAASDWNERERITDAIKMAIEIFDPRFFNVSVTLEPISSVDRELVFRIRATLDVEPTPEPIVFDTVLQLASGEFVVKES